MLEVRQDAMRDAMPLLGYCFSLVALLHMVVGLADSLEILRAHWLAFESIAAVAAGCLALDTLRQFTQAPDLCLGHTCRPPSAGSARARAIVVRLWHEWNAIIRGRVRVRPKEHSERWTRATLPLASSATHHLPDCIPTARHLQAELLGDAPTHDHRSVNAELRHREIMFAHRALASLLHFLGTVMQGHIAILRFPVDVMLHTAEYELSIL